MDTGSTGIVVSADKIPNIDRLPSLGPGRLTYSSSGRIMIGRWVVTPVTIMESQRRERHGCADYGAGRRPGRMHRQGPALHAARGPARDFDAGMVRPAPRSPGAKRAEQESVPQRRGRQWREGGAAAARLSRHPARRLRRADGGQHARRFRLRQARAGGRGLGADAGLHLGQRRHARRLRQPAHGYRRHRDVSDGPREPGAGRDRTTGGRSPTLVARTRIAISVPTEASAQALYTFTLGERGNPLAGGAASRQPRPAAVRQYQRALPQRFRLSLRCRRRVRGLRWTGHAAPTIGKVVPTAGPPAAPRPRSRHARTRRLESEAMSSPSVKTAPYGSWKSPIISDLIVAQSICCRRCASTAGTRAYWLEGRPQEQRRIVVVGRGGYRADRYHAANTALPRDARIRRRRVDRARRHGLFLQLCRRPPLSPGAERARAAGADGRAAPARKGWRFADGVIDDRRNRWIGVREITRSTASRSMPSSPSTSAQGACGRGRRRGRTRSRADTISMRRRACRRTGTGSPGWVGSSQHAVERHHALPRRDHGGGVLRRDGADRRRSVGIDLPAGMVARRRAARIRVRPLRVVESLWSRPREPHDAGAGADGGRVRRAAMAVWHVDLCVRRARSHRLRLFKPGSGSLRWWI